MTVVRVVLVAILVVPAVQAELFRSYVTEWQVGSSQQRASHAASDGSSSAAHTTRATPYP